MLKLFVNDLELEPVGLGAQEGNVGGRECLVLSFRSNMELNSLIKIFKDLNDDAVIKIQNEKRTRAFTDYVVLSGEIGVHVTDAATGTYQYEFTLFRKSALEIAKQAKADVEYLALLSGFDL